MTNAPRESPTDVAPVTRIIVPSRRPDDPHLDNVRQLAWLLDQAFVIPGTRFRVVWTR